MNLKQRINRLEHELVVHKKTNLLIILQENETLEDGIKRQYGDILIEDIGHIFVIEDCDAHLKSWPLPREENFLSDEP